MTANATVRRLLTVTDVARICGVSKQTVYRWATQNGLPSIRVGPSRLRISPDDLERWLERGRRR